MARKFLYIVAAIIVAVIVGAIALSVWSREATKLAMVPRAEFVEQAPLEVNAYHDPAMWYSRPGIGVDDPARYRPSAAEQKTSGPPLDTPPFAVFFVHPTSYIRDGATADWNAKLEDDDTELRARLFLKGMASAFNGADEIWAPKYRQAVAGAFLTDKDEANKAIAMAYRDVEQAFDFFLTTIPKDKPIILAGHSQGAAHILTLLRRKVAGTPLEGRIAAVYAPGWPISVKHDLPALPLPACAAAGQASCLLAWSSIGDGGDPELIMERYEGTPGLDGQPRGEGPILCVNPLTGAAGGDAPAEANLGTLVPNEALTAGNLVVGAVPARCDARGLLMIGTPPALGEGVLPGENYHVYDIPLFWKNLHEDVIRRVRTWAAKHK